MNKRIYDEISKFEPFDAKEALDKEVMLEFIKNNDDVLVRDNKIAHMTTSGWVTNKDRNKILMIYHNIYDSWAWVGGHADGDEEKRDQEPVPDAFEPAEQQLVAFAHHP